MGRPLEEVAKKVLLVWDTSDVEGELKDCMDELREALKERWKVVTVPSEPIASIINEQTEILKRIEEKIDFTNLRVKPFY